ncbi:hypothetical protein ACOME3_003095 [Neoechinorhynchus agilis]
MKMTWKLFCMRQRSKSKQRTIKQDENSKTRSFRRILSYFTKCIRSSESKDKENGRLNGNEKCSMDCINQMDVSVIHSDLDNNVTENGISCKYPKNKNAWQDLRERWAKIVEDVMQEDKGEIMIAPVLKKKEQGETPIMELDTDDTSTCQANSKLIEPNLRKITQHKTLTTKNAVAELEEYRCIIITMLIVIVLLLLLCAIFTGMILGKFN